MRRLGYQRYGAHGGDIGADETVRKLVPAPPGAHWTEFARGKHFPAMEAPAELAADLQAFFGPLR
jgi:epoxide hydrolase